MADQKWPQSIENNFPNLSLRHVLLLQAHIRGLIVRLQMKRVREEFVTIFNEVQQNDDLFVSWKNEFLCLPTFTTVKEEESKCLRLKSIKKSDDPRETTPVESNKAITTKRDQKDVCSPRDERRLSATSSQNSVKAADEEDNDLDSRFVDGENESRKSLLNPENPSLPVSRACFENLHIVERDSESVKAVISSNACRQNNPETTLHKQEHLQAAPPPGNGVVSTFKGKDDLCCSQDPSDDSKNIHSTHSPVCLKPTEKDDRSESHTLDSTFTDVTSVWGDSVRSLSPSVDSMCETPSPETVVSLQLQRQNIALELVWLQQAIASRKNYLRLKHQMDFS